MIRLAKSRPTSHNSFRTKFLNIPNVVSNPGFHCGSNAEGLVHAAEVIKRKPECTRGLGADPAGPLRTVYGFASRAARIANTGYVTYTNPISE
jgi:hypothetical protein